MKFLPGDRVKYRGPDTPLVKYEDEGFITEVSGQHHQVMWDRVWNQQDKTKRWTLPYFASELSPQYGTKWNMNSLVPMEEFTSRCLYTPPPLRGDPNLKRKVQ